MKPVLLALSLFILSEVEVVEVSKVEGTGIRETIEYEVVRKGQCMAQSHDAKRDVKKKAQKTLKEKRLAKKMKKAGLSA